jgi:hypothetical protein
MSSIPPFYNSRKGRISKIIATIFGQHNAINKDSHAICEDLFKALDDAGWLRSAPIERYSVTVIPLTEPNGGLYQVVDGERIVAVFTTNGEAEQYVDYLRNTGG